MSLFGMDGGESLRGGVNLSLLAVAVLIIGPLAIAESGQGEWKRATVMAAICGGLTVAALLGQWRWSRRRGATGRAICATLAGGPPLIVGLIGLLFGIGHLYVGEPATTLFGLGVAAAGALSGWAAWDTFKRSRTRLLPPFHPLNASVFADDLDPPAYPPPRELEVVHRHKGGIMERLRRALGLPRK